MTQLTLEMEKKEVGMKLAADRCPEMLSLFRTIANILADTFPEQTIDDVRKYADLKGIKYIPGPWIGSVYKGDKWETDGRTVPATHVGSHGRRVLVWHRK